MAWRSKLFVFALVLFVAFAATLLFEADQQPTPGSESTEQLPQSGADFTPADGLDSGSVKLSYRPIDVGSSSSFSRRTVISRRMGFPETSLINAPYLRTTKLEFSGIETLLEKEANKSKSKLNILSFHRSTSPEAENGGVGQGLSEQIRGEYQIERDGNAVTDLAKKDSELTEQAEEFVRTGFSTPTFGERFARFIDGRIWVIGQWEELPSELRDPLFEEAHESMLMLSREEERWGRRLFVFEASSTKKLDNAVPGTAAQSIRSITVDSETGRVMKVQTELSSQELVRAADEREFVRNTLLLSTIHYRFSDFPIFQDEISVVNPNFPGGTIIDFSLSADDKRLYFLEEIDASATIDGARLGFYDIERGRVTHLSREILNGGVRASALDPEAFLVFDDELPMLQTYVASGTQKESFGRKAYELPDSAWITEHAYAGRYVLLGTSGGLVGVFNLGLRRPLLAQIVSAHAIERIQYSPDTQTIFILDASGALKSYPLLALIPECLSSLSPPDGCAENGLILGEVAIELQLPDSLCAKGLYRQTSIANNGTVIAVPRGPLEASSAGQDCSLPNGFELYSIQANRDTVLDDPKFIVSGSVGKFSSTSETFVTELGVWELESGRQIATFSEPFSGFGTVKKLELSHDDGLAILLSDLGDVEIIDLESLLEVPGPQRIANNTQQLLHGSRLYTSLTEGRVLTETLENGDIQTREAIVPSILIRTDKGLFLSPQRFDRKGEKAVLLRDHVFLDSTRDIYFFDLEHESLVGYPLARDMPLTDSLDYQFYNDSALPTVAYVTVNGNLVLNDGGTRTEVPNDDFDDVDFKYVSHVFIRGDGLSRKLFVVEHKPFEETRVAAFNWIASKPIELKYITYIGNYWGPGLRADVSDDGEKIAVSPIMPPPDGHWNPSGTLTILLDAGTGKEKYQFFNKFGQIADLSFLPDGSELMFATQQGDLRVWDSELGVETRNLKAHDGTITSIVGFGAKRFQTQGDDAVLRIWDFDRFDLNGSFKDFEAYWSNKLIGSEENAAKVVDIFAGGDGFVSPFGPSVAIAPDAYYAGDARALSRLGFVDRDGPFNFERYDLWLNRPDIVLGRMRAVSKQRGKRLARVQSLRKQLHGAETGDQFFWMRGEAKVNVALSSTMATNHNTASVRVTLEAAEGYDQLVIQLDGIPVRSRSIKGSPSQELEFEVPLQRGQNSIGAVISRADGKKVISEIVSVTRHSDYEPGKVWLFAVGVSEYSDDDLKLQYAAKDAQDLVDFAKRNFGHDMRYELRVDDQVTSSVIEEANSFFRQASAADTVILFVSGHGFLDEYQSYYFGAHDIDPANPTQGGIEFSALLEAFENIDAINRTMWIDSCFSGALYSDQVQSNARFSPDSKVKVADGRKRGIGVRSENRSYDENVALLRAQFADLNSQTGAYILSSSGGLEYSYETDSTQNGVFTHSILEAFRRNRADLDGNGLVDIWELDAFVTQNVRSLTNGGQVPTAKHRNIYTDFAFPKIYGFQ